MTAVRISAVGLWLASYTTRKSCSATSPRAAREIGKLRLKTVQRHCVSYGARHWQLRAELLIRSELRSWVWKARAVGCTGIRLGICFPTAWALPVDLIKEPATPLT